MTNKSINISEAHAFNVDVAVRCGVNSAIVYNHVHFWIKSNQAKKKNFHDGRCWMYQSISEMSEHFPYLTKKQITTALDKLSDAGLIFKDNFNKAKYDRTTWYSLNPAETVIFPVGEMDLPSGDNGFALTVSPIPYNNTDNKTDDVDIDHFEEFWVQCPRRIGKGAARKAFKTALTKASFTEIMAGMHKHAAAVDGSDIKYVPHPATWLNAERWSDQNEPSNKAQGKSAGNHGDIFDIATEVLARRKARRELRADGIQDNGEADAGTTPRIEGPDRGDIQATVRRANHDGAAATQSYHQGAVYEFQ